VFDRLMDSKRRRSRNRPRSLLDIHNFLGQGSAVGSIRLGSLFLTLPMGVLTGQAIMSSEG
jgi:hypothetical protein